MRTPGPDSPPRLLRRVVYALLCCVLATPLVTSGAALFPLSAQAFAARTLIEVAAFLYCWLALREPACRPRAGALGWAVLAYSGVVLAAAVLGADPYRSFWGNLERMNGAWGLLHAALLFVIARGVLRTRTDWLRLLEFSLLVSGVVAALAVAEGLRIAGTPQPRPGSTLGHPDFLATYTLFHAFFALIVLFLEPVRPLRWLAGLLLALNVVALGLAASRGAWVGLYASMVCAAAAFALTVPRRRAAAVTALVLLLALPVAIRALPGTPLAAGMPHIVQRLAGSSLADPSIRSRLRAVPMALAALADRPLLGFGPDNYRIAFDRHYAATDPVLEQWFDHAHNKLADVAVETGLIGTLAYLALLAVAARLLVHRLRRTPQDAERAAAAIMLLLGVAYFVQNLFLFDTPTSHMLFFLCLAFVAYLTDAPLPAQAASPTATTPARLVLAAAAALTLAAIVWTNALPYRASVLARAGLAAQAPADALAAYRQALAHAGFTRAEINRANLDQFIDRGRARLREWTPLYTELRTQVEAQLAAGATDVRAFMRVANLYNERSEVDAQLLADAERTSRAGIALSPARPDAYYELGVTYLKARDYARAHEVFGRVTALGDGILWAHWGRALALLGDGRREEGEAALDRALAHGADWDRQPEVYVLTRAFVTAQPPPPLVPLYERVIAARPEVARYRVMLARAYAQAGDAGRARAQALAAATLDPSLAADARRFIEGLPAE